MASIKERLAALFRRLERRLGVDREGRTVWVWLLPPGVGIASAVLVAFMPGMSERRRMGLPRCPSRSSRC